MPWREGLGVNFSQHPDYPEPVDDTHISHIGTLAEPFAGKELYALILMGFAPEVFNRLQYDRLGEIP